MTTSSDRAEGFDLVILYRLVQDTPPRFELRLEHLEGGETETRELNGPLTREELVELLHAHIARHKPERVFFKVETGAVKALSPETKQQIITGELHPRDIYIGG